MNTVDKTGGAAFPGFVEGLEWEGMTLRDYFAAKAMQGLVLDEGWSEWKKIAGVAYNIADAMIAERAKEE